MTFEQITTVYRNTVQTVKSLRPLRIANKSVPDVLLDSFELFTQFTMLVSGTFLLHFSVTNQVPVLPF